MTQIRRASTRWLIILAVLASALVAVVGSASAQESDDTNSRWWDSATCLTCHDQTDLRMTLDSGLELVIGIDRGSWTDSTHTTNSVECRHCHTDKVAYPHEGPVPSSAEAFSDLLNPACETCHIPFSANRSDILHADTLLCTNCHDPHAVSATGSQESCKECHAVDQTIPEAGIHALQIAEEGPGGSATNLILMSLAALALFILIVWLLTVAWRALRSR